MSDKKPLYREKIGEELIPCIIPDGEYEVTLVAWGNSYYNATPKLLMLWMIVTEGEHKGKMLPRYYNLSSWDKETRTPIPTGNSLYAIQYRKFHGTPRTKRGYNPEDFAGLIYVVSVEQCEKDEDKCGWFTKANEILLEFK